MGTLEQITKLIDAGYTKDEIAQLFTEEAAKEQPAPEPTQEAAPEPKEPDRIDAAIAKIEALADSVAKLAIMNSQQPPREGTDEFLARMINPHYGKE